MKDSSRRVEGAQVERAAGRRERESRSGRSEGVIGPVERKWNGSREQGFVRFSFSFLFLRSSLGFQQSSFYPCTDAIKGCEREVASLRFKALIGLAIPAIHSPGAHFPAGPVEDGLGHEKGFEGSMWRCLDTEVTAVEEDCIGESIRGSAGGSQRGKANDSRSGER